MYVSDYDELEIIAPAIEKALNSIEPVLSNKFTVSKADGFEFYTPAISVCTAEEYIISTFNFRLTKGQSPWTQEEVLEQLYKDYNNCVDNISVGLEKEQNE